MLTHANMCSCADSSTFINDVFKVLANKSYLPPSARPKPAESHSYDPTLPLEGFQPIQTPQYPGTAPLNGSRKRSYHEGLGDEGQGPSYYPGARRAFKQPRRGYGVPDAPLDYGAPSFPPAQAASPNLLSASSAYANIPPLDPTHTQAFPFPPSSYPGQAMARPNPYMRKKKPRCWEFDSKGYCSRGLTCKYDHSIDFSAMQPPQLPAGGDTDEGTQCCLAVQNTVVGTFTDTFQGYDPEDPTFILHAPPPLPMPPPVNHGRGSSRRRRGESRRGGRGRGRAAFSADGPLKDPKRTAIVVENIPEESFSEDLVRDFFSQFGTIVEVSMRPYKHLAIVKFDSHQTANAAYRSPKVIFDNRFVKVFWYKEEADGPTLGRGKASNGTNGHEGTPSEQDGPEIDMEDFMQKQAEAQKAYEEKRERREALQKQKEELDKRQQELIEKQLQAKQKLEARLGSAATGDETPNSTAGSLRMQLKKLEEEARILGLDPHDQSHAHGEGSTTSHEGVWTRGGYRGRGGYRARGRGRGGYRGGYGGGYGDVHEAYAAYSLDNRPRKVAVTGADFTVPANDEALRQFLLVSSNLLMTAIFRYGGLSRINLIEG